MYFSIPQEYRELPNEELKDRIRAAKKKLGGRLCILTHHYQRIELIEFGDHLGDSYALSKQASQQKDVEAIIFCGVHFMAESADILTDTGKAVYLPNPLAGCPMADMAEMPDVMAAWEHLKNFGGAERIMPISYMNTAAGLKAFTGRNGGTICTSSNAKAAFEWAFAQRDKIFFFPDQHLGYNTSIDHGLAPEEIVIWDFSRDDGGLTEQQIEAARVILWKGHCHVHTNFKSDHITEVRQKHPGVKIVVHPECPHEVVSQADAVGSTKFIVEFCQQAPAGSTIAIGTEINLTHRMAVEHPDKKIFELSGNICPVCANMYRTTLNDLAYTIENFAELKPINVTEPNRSEALLALQRMLEIA
jgi:quinolinate synthase